MSSLSQWLTFQLCRALSLFGTCSTKSQFLTALISRSKHTGDMDGPCKSCGSLEEWDVEAMLNTCVFFHFLEKCLPLGLMPQIFMPRNSTDLSLWGVDLNHCVGEILIHMNHLVARCKYMFLQYTVYIHIIYIYINTYLAIYIQT